MDNALETDWPYATCVQKKRDGLMVSYGPHVLDFMHWHEGIVWRLTKRLPKRIERKAKAALGAYNYAAPARAALAAIKGEGG